LRFEVPRTSVAVAALQRGVSEVMIVDRWTGATNLCYMRIGFLLREDRTRMDVN
jgi:hypothetical protein